MLEDSEIAQMEEQFFELAGMAEQRQAEDELLRSVGRDRLVELAQAERDGRLVVLTCKVGDTVFCVVNGCLWPEAECPEGSSSCDTCRENKKTVIENKLDCMESVVIASEHWGETVFATLQEAEAAEREEV